MSASRPRGRLLPTIAFLLIAFLAYLPALRAGWIWDDDEYVWANPNLIDFSGLLSIWFNPRSIPQYYPLVHTSYWFEYRLWGLWPPGYHAVNVLLHGLNAALLFGLLRRAGWGAAAWLAAAIFALHPVHVESVAWVTERKNVLSCCFMLLALGYYMRSIEWPPALPGAPPARVLRGFYAAALACFLAALLAKTVTCVLPVVILILIWWRRGRLTPGDFWPLAPFFAIGLALGLTTVHLERVHVGAQGGEFALGIGERLLLACRTPWFYAGKLVWPANLTFIYPRWSIHESMAPFMPYVALTLLLPLLLWLGRGRWGRGPLAAVLAFFALLFPASGLFNVFPFRYSFVADHFQYHASLALIVPAAWSITRLPACLAGRSSLFAPALRRGIAVLAIVALLATLGLLTTRQAMIYRSAETLWVDTINKNPGAAIAFNNLGTFYAELRDYARAERIFGMGLERHPEDADLWGNFGSALLEQQRPAEAEEPLSRALALDPENPWFLNTLARLHEGRGEHAEAEALFRRAIARSPRMAESYLNLAALLAATGRLPEARALLQSGMDRNPRDERLAEAAARLE